MVSCCYVVLYLGTWQLSSYYNLNINCWNVLSRGFDSLDTFYFSKDILAYTSNGSSKVIILPLFTIFYNISRTGLSNQYRLLPAISIIPTTLVVRYMVSIGLLLGFSSLKYSFLTAYLSWWSHNYWIFGYMYKTKFNNVIFVASAEVHCRSFTLVVIL